MESLRLRSVCGMVAAIVLGAAVLPGCSGSGPSLGEIMNPPGETCTISGLTAPLELKATYDLLDAGADAETLDPLLVKRVNVYWSYGSSVDYAARMLVLGIEGGDEASQQQLAEQMAADLDAEVTLNHYLSGSQYTMAVITLPDMNYTPNELANAGDWLLRHYSDRIRWIEPNWLLTFHRASRCHLKVAIKAIFRDMGYTVRDEAPMVARAEV